MIPPAVDLAWLKANPDAVIADVRWYLDGRSGREAYEQGHLPGAVFVDLDRDLAGPPGAGAGRHPLPEANQFAAAMGRLGVSRDTTVVAYDDAGGTVAARLVWMLRALGTEAALLDGGIGAYDGPLQSGTVEPAGTLYPARPWPAALLADIGDASDRANVVIDAREPARYRGDLEPVDPRAGHIPGARNLPCRSNLDAAGRFLPATELRRLFLAAGAGPGTVSYCGSGVTACHNLLALELAGLGPGRLYPGSWSEYSSEPSRPAEIGPYRL